MKILVTGAAGFIGSKIACLLARRGDEVVGIDNLNDYYDRRLKWGHLRLLGIETENNDFAPYGEYHSHKFDKVRFIPMSLDDRDAMVSLFAGERFDKVVNLAAQAGVRYSIENPYAYLQSNIVGFLNLLECCRHYPVEHLLFASSSSVYGLNAKAPFSEDDKVDCPVSFYAATKKSDELMAHAYSKLYNIPATGLRYFTVYGPWGRYQGVQQWGHDTRLHLYRRYCQRFGDDARQASCGCRMPEWSSVQSVQYRLLAPRETNGFHCRDRECTGQKG